MSVPNPPIEDRDEFLRDVEGFMQQRGVPFDRDARASGRAVDLHDLYYKVLARGGYDKLSAERMAWRTLVKDYGIQTEHEPAMTFQLKTVYYKNLAAYEIFKAWGEDPPPPDILENLTAKGGDLRNRRRDNFTMNQRVSAPDAGSNDGDSESRRTPSRDGQVEEPGSGSRYPARHLRQDPRRTQIYQPDPTPSRPRPNYMRTDSPHASPAPTQQYSHVGTDPRHPSFTLDKYEPQQPIALTLRPLPTPGSNPEIFYQQKAMRQAQAMPRLPPDPTHLDQLKQCIAPQVFQGPNIYTRCHFGLMSGIKEEEDFALHHLVKVSDERGDKFTFSGFPYLAEALIEKCLQICDIVYGIEWQVSYDQKPGISLPGVLNAAHGTPNLRESVLALQPLDHAVGHQGRIFSDRLERLNEAALVIRNMVTLEANSLFLSRLGIFKDFLIIATNLPQQSRLFEFQQYALEMAEHTTRYWDLESDDALYLSLLEALNSTDRNFILSALRSITRLGIESDKVFKLTHVSRTTVDRIVGFLLLEDDELVELALEFLYEFTAMDDNVTAILREDPSVILGVMPKLTEMLIHNPSTFEEKIQNRMFPSRQQLLTSIPRIPQELFTNLLQYAEPERSSRWLRCCFQESAEDDVTQIAIWQAYSAVFESARPIPAAEFIKNVSSTFTNAQAQVISGPTPRFIIKGIKARRVLIDPQGRPFFKCLWGEPLRPTDPVYEIYDNIGQKRVTCGQWHASRQRLWFHVLADHLKMPHDSSGKFVAAHSVKPVKPSSDTQDAPGEASTSAQPAANSQLLDDASYKCLWSTCSRMHAVSGAKAMSTHIRCHIPETAEVMSKMLNDLAVIPDPRHPYKPNETQDDMFTRHTFYYTAVDERNQPCGIPFLAIMLMRNLARYVSRNGASVEVPSFVSDADVSARGSPVLEGRDQQAYSSSSIDGAQNNNSASMSDMSNAAKTPSPEAVKRRKLMARIFSVPVRQKLFFMLSVQRTLAALLVDLLGMIEKGERSDDERKRKISDYDMDEPGVGMQMGMGMGMGTDSSMMTTTTVTSDIRGPVF